MRTEQQMMELILQVARQDERVRIVGMNGSRINANVPRDCFQDYDIVYLVTDMQSFLNDPTWIDVFGKRIILQTPEGMSLFPPTLGGWYTYLMLFEDRNRIDLMLIPIEELGRYLQNDGLTKILLDKDGRVPSPPVPTDRAYHVKRPTAGHLEDSCNEFWWLSTYVAKGLCRRELLYAAEHLASMRRELLRMLAWKVGAETNFSLSVGKCHKYLQQYLPAAEWNALTSTLNAATYQDCWDSLFTACNLFRQTSCTVAKQLELPFPAHLEQSVWCYLNQLKQEDDAGQNWQELPV